jgi:ATP-binding cassette subfamily B protein
MRVDQLVVFFDEPTTSLDAQTERTLFEQYAAAARAGIGRGMVTILVSHRFSTVRAADRILVLANRQVAEHGTHVQLVAAGGRYVHLYQMQARSYLPS